MDNYILGQKAAEVIDNFYYLMKDRYQEKLPGNFGVMKENFKSQICSLLDGMCIEFSEKLDSIDEKINEWKESTENMLKGD